MEGQTLVQLIGGGAPEWFMGLCMEPWCPPLLCQCQVWGWIPQVSPVPCVCISAGLLCKEGGHSGPSSYASGVPWQLS